MTKVVKRDNKKENFDEGKITRAIESAAKEAKLPPNKIALLLETGAKNIIRYASNEKEIRSSTIRENILNTLDVTEPVVSRSWRDYDRRVKGIS